jgi:hypothetical protein
VELERHGWQALASGGAKAASFYRRCLASNFVMLLPGGLVLDDRDRAVAAMSGTPWDSFEMSDVRVVPLGLACSAVTYRAGAERAGRQYAALVSSIYVIENGDWRLALHQQTPV